MTISDKSRSQAKINFGLAVSLYRLKGYSSSVNISRPLGGLDGSLIMTIGLLWMYYFTDLIGGLGNA